MVATTAGAMSTRPSTRVVIVPPCQWYSTRPVFKTIGYSSSGSSMAAGPWRTGVNRASPLGRGKFTVHRSHVRGLRGLLQEDVLNDQELEVAHRVLRMCQVGFVQERVFADHVHGL